jgi:hypothetical protein
LRTAVRCADDHGNVGKTCSLDAGWNTYLQETDPRERNRDRRVGGRSTGFERAKPCMGGEGRRRGSYHAMSPRTVDTARLASEFDRRRIISLD